MLDKHGAALDMDNLDMDTLDTDNLDMDKVGWLCGVFGAEVILRIF